CHSDVAATYHKHSMGRSAAPMAERVNSERYEHASGNPFMSGPLLYQIERQGERVFHKEIARDAQGRGRAERAAEVAFVVGSGGRGFSYVINEDGFLFQSPISWYSQKESGDASVASGLGGPVAAAGGQRGSWDLSPGYPQRQFHFDRGLGGDCFFC